MPSLDPNSEDFAQSLAVLGPDLAHNIFRPFAEKRQPRTSALVKEARSQGERRVIVDPDLCRRRDEIIVSVWKDSAVVADKYRKLLCEPFQSLEV